MEELINQVAQRTGLSPDKARTAMDTVLSFVKGRLPAPIATQLDSALAGGGGGTSTGNPRMPEAVQGLGSKFGGQ